MAISPSTFHTSSYSTSPNSSWSSSPYYLSQHLPVGRSPSQGSAKSIPHQSRSGSAPEIYGSYSSSVTLAKSSRLHPNSIYSSSPRSIDLVSPFRVPQSASDPAPVVESELIFDPTFDVPFMFDRPSRHTAGSSPPSGPRDGNAKRLF